MILSVAPENRDDRSFIGFIESYECNLFLDSLESSQFQHLSILLSVEKQKVGTWELSYAWRGNPNFVYIYLPKIFLRVREYILINEL